MQTAVQTAFLIHTLLCVAYLGLLARALAGHPVELVEDGPCAVVGATAPVAGVFYAATGLYLLYAEIYLLRVQHWASLVG